MDRKRLGEILTERGALSQEQLDEALAEQQVESDRLGERLVAKGLVSKTDIGAAIECIKGVSYIECPPEKIDPEVLALVPAEVAARCCALPVSMSAKTLVVAMGEPQNMALLEELEFCSGMKIDPRFSFRSDVVRGIRMFYGDVVNEAETEVEASASPPESVSVTAPVGGPGRRVGHRMTWTARAVVCGALTVAGLVGWASGTLVQEAASGLLVGQGAKDPLVSPQPRVNSLPAQSDMTNPDPPEAAAATPSDIATSITPVKSDTMVTETEPTATPSEPAAVEPQARPTTTDFGTTIQVGAFRDRANATRLVEALRAKHDQVHMSLIPSALYVVTLGPFDEKRTADRIAEEIKQEMDLSPLVVRTRL